MSKIEYERLLEISEEWVSGVRFIRLENPFCKIYFSYKNGMLKAWYSFGPVCIDEMEIIVYE